MKALRRGTVGSGHFYYHRYIHTIRVPCNDVPNDYDFVPPNVLCESGRRISGVRIICGLREFSSPLPKMESRFSNKQKNHAFLAFGSDISVQYHKAVLQRMHETSGALRKQGRLTEPQSLQARNQRGKISDPQLCRNSTFRARPVITGSPTIPRIRRRNPRTGGCITDGYVVGGYVAVLLPRHTCQLFGRFPRAA